VRQMQLLRSVFILFSTCFFLAGCGSSSDNPVFPGPNAPVQTGNVVVNLTSVDPDTTDVLIRIRRRNISGNDGIVFSEETALTPTITLENVPIIGQSLEIVTLDEDRLPLEQFLGVIQITPGGTLTVNSSDLQRTALDLTDVVVEPNPITVEATETVEVAVRAVYSTVLTRTLSGDALAEVTVDSSNNAVATGAGNMVTGNAVGTATLTYTFRTRSTEVPVTVE